MILEGEWVCRLAIYSNAPQSHYVIEGTTCKPQGDTNRHHDFLIVLYVIPGERAVVLVRNRPPSYSAVLGHRTSRSEERDTTHIIV